MARGNGDGEVEHLIAVAAICNDLHFTPHFF